MNYAANLTCFPVILALFIIVCMLSSLLAVAF